MLNNANVEQFEQEAEIPYEGRQINRKTIYLRRCRLAIIFLAPLFLSVKFRIEDESLVIASRCLTVSATMLVYWATEALPLATTALIPIVAFPLLGILDTDRVCMMYMREPMVLFIASLILAQVFESSNLHRRVALSIITATGYRPQALNILLSVATMLLSMRISNTFVVALMCPIIKATLEELDCRGVCKMFVSQEETAISKPPVPSKTAKAFYLSVAFASIFGEIGSFSTSPAGFTLRGIYETTFPNAEGLNTSKWLTLTIPVMLIFMVATWGYLQCVFREKNHNEEANSRVFEQHKSESLSFFAVTTGIAIIFALLLLLLETKQLLIGFFDTRVKVKDASMVLLVVIMLFVSFATAKVASGSNGCKNYPSWRQLNAQIPWSFIFVFGGGYAIAEGGKVSGMSRMLGQSLLADENLAEADIFDIIFKTCIISQFLTEFTPNVVVLNVLLPVLIEISIQMHTNPLLLMFPTALSSCFTLLTPIGTPVNAIVASMGNINMKDIALGGIAAKILSLVIVTGFKWFGPIFLPELQTFPDLSQIAPIEVNNLS